MTIPAWLSPAEGVAAEMLCRLMRWALGEPEVIGIVRSTLRRECGLAALVIGVVVDAGADASGIGYPFIGGSAERVVDSDAVGRLTADLAIVVFIQQQVAKSVPARVARARLIGGQQCSAPPPCHPGR